MSVTLGALGRRRRDPSHTTPGEIAPDRPRRQGVLHRAAMGGSGVTGRDSRRTYIDSGGTMPSRRLVRLFLWLLILPLVSVAVAAALLA
jgi:hypothetical protein